MKIICLPVGPIQSNVYIYYDENTRDAILIDCGDNAKKIISVLESNKLKLKGILLTHGHFDHIHACHEVKAYADVPIYAGKNEIPLLKNSYMNRSGVLGRMPVNLEIDIAFEDGEIFEFSGHKLKVLFTPGHTYGSVCYYNEEGGILFTGDTLFLLSVGRTDLKTGSYAQLVESLLNILYKLPKDVVVYPGHGPETSIGFEIKNNPEINIDTDLWD